ncbi:nitroreductase/quinone reductase family protein [Lolliginicoccus levis]|uniref:nitroreductase/quinone reductase family protein n=1 Tax=Lolliginicoccus levis TaxID=2919542 RepID=UPI00241F921D|nr:nitroreductase/quinone reductase family protein [Lolliginicoccus levis]
MPSDLMLKTMNVVHRGIVKVSGGRLGNSIAGMPVIELVTVGRKSGEERICYLTSPLQRGETLIVVASRGGDDHHPAWYHNLRAQPEVEIIRDGTRIPVRARTATQEERAELWPEVVRRARNYGGYQKNTSREIPLVLLEPR